MKHPYTLAPLAAGDPRVVPRTPGVGDIARLFPAPASIGRGRLAVEGGVSIVAGPGLGKTTLLAQLGQMLDRDRDLATGVVTFPSASGLLGEDGFYRYLGALLAAVRASLLESPRVWEEPFAAVRAHLDRDPSYDGGEGAMTPRGFESWMRDLGGAAVHAPGIALLFDDVDEVAPATWKPAFIAALRFTFQSCAGVTPIYALYRVYGDEAQPGSNYFRNVTRPLFLEPLSRTNGNGGPSERDALVRLALPALPAPAIARIGQLAGGHPGLLSALLGALAAALPEGSDGTDVTAGDVEALLDHAAVDEQHALAVTLLGRTPGLAEALRELAASEPRSHRSVARGIVASGLVDEDDAGNAVIPGRVREVL